MKHVANIMRINDCNPTNQLPTAAATATATATATAAATAPATAPAKF